MMREVLRHMHNTIVIFLLIISGFTVISCTGCSKVDGSFRDRGSHWTCGFDAREIVPDNFEAGTYYIAGYGVEKEASGILDPQFVRAVWLDDNSGRGGVVMVSVDCIGLVRSDIENIRADLRGFATETGCRSVNIFSTHTHAGIDTLGIWGPVLRSGKDEDFMNKIRRETVIAVLAAYDARRDGELYSGSSVIEDILHDSRDPQVFSRNLHRIRFVPSDGSSGLQMIHLGAHPEALRSENTLVSADFPCYLGRRIKDLSGDEFVYFTGAIGGLINTRRLIDENGQELDVYASTVRTGELLADAALGITNDEPLEPSLNIRTTTYKTPLENPVFLVEKFLGILSTDAVRGIGPYNRMVVTEVSYAEIGNLKAVFVPGELFPELAYGTPDSFIGAAPDNADTLTFGEIIGDDDFLVFGLANDEIGYIVPPCDFFLHDTLPYIENGRDTNGRRHYEETNSVGPRSAPDLAEALEEIMKEIASK